MVCHDGPDSLLFNSAYRCHQPIFYYGCGHVASDEVRQRLCWRCRQLGWLCVPERIEISRRNLDCPRCEQVHAEAAAIARQTRRVQRESQGAGWNMEREMKARREDMERWRRVAEQLNREAEQRDQATEAAVELVERPSAEEDER